VWEVNWRWQLALVGSWLERAMLTVVVQKLLRASVLRPLRVAGMAQNSLSGLPVMFRNLTKT
jgi:hypothetical protein